MSDEQFQFSDISHLSDDEEANLLYFRDEALRYFNYYYSWYEKGAQKKKTNSVDIRTGSIILLVFGLLCLPLENSLAKYAVNWKFDLSDFGYIFFILAAGLSMYDRFEGSSSSWMRYRIALVDLEKVRKNFEIDWGEKNSSDISTKFGLIRDFVIDVNEIVTGETRSWVTEFSTFISRLDSQLEDKAKLNQ